MFLKKKKAANTSGGNIVVIGPRSSGKTTYLAALAYWHKRREEAKKTQGTIFSIQPLNDDAKKLQKKAEDIIIAGDSFRPTKVTPEGIDLDSLPEEQLAEYELELPNYLFQIEINPPFSEKKEINLNVKDYAGELFDDHLDNSGSHGLYQQIWEDSLSEDIEGCLILLSGWYDDDDRRYSQNLTKFIELMDRQNRLNNYRLAVAFSKCERGEIWPGRIEPYIDIFKNHLPRTKAALEGQIPKHNLEFYALSTFGVLRRNDPRPNRVILYKKEGYALKDRERWQPYNLISPLYWLSTGQKANFLKEF
jgi:hypothetical protein